MSKITFKVEIKRPCLVGGIKDTTYFDDPVKAIKFIQDVAGFEFPGHLVEEGEPLTVLLDFAEILEEKGITVTFITKKAETDKEKLLSILENYSDNLTFEQMIFLYMDIYHKDFPADRIHRLIKDLNDNLYGKICDLENCKLVAKERATYLKAYLEGKMYTSKEVAEEHVGIQVKHAETIINTCDDNFDMSKHIEESMKL